MRGRFLFWLVVAAALGPGTRPAGAHAQVFLSQEEALRQAFPAPARVERRSAFLGAEELARAQALAGDEAPVEQTVVSYYVAFRGDRPLGAAYFDAHRVRTLPEVLMIVVTPAGEIREIEVLRFSEPPEYLPPQGWLDLFGGRLLDEGLSVKGRIPTMTGATLTTRAVTGAARRVLALHRVIAPFGSTGAEGALPGGQGSGEKGGARR